MIIHISAFCQTTQDCCYCSFNALNTSVCVQNRSHRLTSQQQNAHSRYQWGEGAVQASLRRRLPPLCFNKFYFCQIYVVFRAACPLTLKLCFYSKFSRFSVCLLRLFISVDDDQAPQAMAWSRVSAAYTSDVNLYDVIAWRSNPLPA